MVSLTQRYTQKDLVILERWLEGHEAWLLVGSMGKPVLQSTVLQRVGHDLTKGLKEATKRTS